MSNERERNMETIEKLIAGHPIMTIENTQHDSTQAASAQAPVEIAGQPSLLALATCSVRLKNMPESELRAEENAAWVTMKERQREVEVARMKAKEAWENWCEIYAVVRQLPSSPNKKDQP